MTLPLSIGAGKDRPQAKRIHVDDVLDAIAKIPSKEEAWFSTHTWKNDYRKAKAWDSSIGSTIDVDHHVVDPNDPTKRVKAPPAQHLVDALNIAIKAGAFPGNAAYLTPNGFRLITLFKGICTDRDEFIKAALANAADVTAALEREGLAGAVDGYEVDQPLVADCGRLFYAPNAIVDGVARKAEIVRMRAEPYDVAELAKRAPAPVIEQPAPKSKQAVSTAVEKTFPDAAGQYNTDHPLEMPPGTKRTKCRACLDPGSWGRVGDSEDRWSCFSTDHGATRCGIESKTPGGVPCWTGDALDLDAHAEGRDPLGQLVATGYLEPQIRQAVSDPSEFPVWGDSTASSPPPKLPKPLRYHRAPDLVDAILKRADEPWVDLSLDGQRIVSLRGGSIVMLIGSSGSGKSTMALAFVDHHARRIGPAIYLSFELDADELGGRQVGMYAGESWENVLRGKVPRETMVEALDLPRLRVVDRDAACVADLDRHVAELRAAHPDEPILVAVDYLQIADIGTDDFRVQVARVSSQLRAAAKRLGVVMIGINQTSRATGKMLRAGELVGFEASAAGAESAAIERDAYVTLTIGVMGSPDDGGYAPVELSIGKARFGGGNQIQPVLWNGRTGVWRMNGEARPAADVVAEREQKRNDAKSSAGKLAMLQFASKSKKSVTRQDLRQASNLRGAIGTTAIDDLIAEGKLVECEKNKGSQYPRIWTPENVQKRREERSHEEND